MPTIILKNVTKRYGEHTVLNEVNTTFQAGKISGIIGRNGSGKTVLLKTICGITAPSSGSVQVGEQIIGTDVDFPPDMGVLIETPAFISSLSGIKNLESLAAIRRKVDRMQISATMESLGLDPTSKKAVKNYSLGMRQKLGIAQAIMESPKLLILDEPMNGLDKESIDHIRCKLKELCENGTTIIMASHYLSDVILMCDNVYEMQSGQLKRLSKEALCSQGFLSI